MTGKHACRLRTESVTVLFEFETQWNKYLVNVVSCCRECTVVYYIHTAILSTTTVNRLVNWKHHTNGEFTTGWVKPQPPFFPSEEHIESIFFVFSRCLVYSIKDVRNHIFVIEEIHLLIWELCIVSIWEKTGG